MNEPTIERTAEAVEQKETIHSTKELYKIIASTIGAFKRCKEKGPAEWENKHKQTIYQLQDLLPSGSGIDCGTKIDLDESSENKIVLNLSFHHMDQNGFYCGSTDHSIIITPDFQNFCLKVTGTNKNQIKEYLCDVYSNTLLDNVQVFSKDGKEWDYRFAEYHKEYLKQLNKTK